MADDDKVAPFKVVPKDQEAELIAFLNQMADRADPIARMRWVWYQAHLKQGFSPEQALTLCQNTRI